MTQTLHILKKDFRRFGFEIGLLTLLLALYTWSQSGAWRLNTFETTTSVSFGNGYGEQLWGPLLVMGWGIILIRVVQEESPAGNRQFWITRPYKWPSLLAARILFLLLVVNIPLLVAQMVVLKLAGFSPLGSFSGLLMMHLRLLEMALVLAALVAISAGFRQVGWALLLFLLYLGGVWSAGSMRPEAAAWHGFSVWGAFGWLILTGVPAIVIVRQYALRRTANARLWMLAGLLSLILLTAATPYHHLIDHEYPPPPPGEQPLFHLELRQQPQPPHVVGHQVRMAFDLTIGKLVPGYAAEIKAILISVEAPDGTRWSSGWRSNYQLLSKDRLDTGKPDQTMWVGLADNIEGWMDEKTFARMQKQNLICH